MIIYETLKKDHEVVKQLLQELVALPDDSDVEIRHSLVSQIRDELVPHSRAEEAVLYNSMRMLDASKGLAFEGFEEHMEAEALLRTLQVMDKMDMSWRPVAQKLKDALEHHIQEEETELFAAAQQLFTSEEAEIMGETFEEMKPRIKEEGLMKTTLEMVKNLLPPSVTSRFENRTH